MTQNQKTAEGNGVKTFLQANIWVIPVGLTLIVLILLYFFGEFDTDTVKKNPIITLVSSYWFWIIVILLVVSLLLRPKLVKNKTEKINWSWKWLWSIPIFIGSAWLIWLVYSTLIAPWLVSKYAESHPTQSNIKYTVDPLNGSPDFNTSGRNNMKKGEFFQFTVEWDDTGISYDPIDSDTTVLHFQKSENATRKWTLKLWKNEFGEKEYLWSPRAPVAKVWVGKIYVKCINRSAVVVVSKKE